MTEPATDQQILEGHLVYELDMLRGTGHLLTVVQSRPDQPLTVIQTNALIESFATHARNLIEFFNNVRYQDTVRAEEFTVSRSYDPEFVQWDQMEDLRVRINKQISHLTRSRGENKVDGIDRQNILRLLLREAEKFRSEVRPDLLQWLPPRFGEPT
jgi:hypothetical protein